MSYSWPVLKIGYVGPEVGNWQRFLATSGFIDQEGNAIQVDEDFGKKTEYATGNFQDSHGLEPTGMLDAMTRLMAQDQGFIPFIQAKNCNVLYPNKRVSVDLIVVHTMEAPDKPDTALDVALWFAGPNAPQASAHFCISPADTIQTVRVTDVAWHAPGANHNGIGLEHAGYARFTAEDWATEAAQAMLERSAKLAAKLALEYNIPIVKISPEELSHGGARGFLGHVDVTNGLNHGIGHQDPGEAFPWQSYLNLVRQATSVQVIQSV